jgi:hypothetical protein
MYTAQKARMNESLNPPSAAPAQGPSLLEQLLNKIDDPYGGFHGKVDTSALDNAFRSALGQINTVRGNANQNFQTSDKNLLGMHEAARNDVLTNGKARFEDISNDQIQGLKQTRDESVGILNQQKAQDNARRMAMLKNLGQEGLATNQDVMSNDPYNKGIESIVSRDAAQLANAQGDKATNLAYNTTVANSIGQQGDQRRSELAQQLQGILGSLGRAEVDTNNQYAQQKAAMQAQAAQQDYAQWGDQRNFDRQRYNDLFGQKQQMEDRAYQMARDQAMMQQKAASQPVLGFGGLAEDLLNTGYDPQQSQQAMGALSQVIASPEMTALPQGSDRTNFIARRLKEQYGIPEVIATQLAVNYGNLGNVRGYTPTPTQGY